MRTQGKATSKKKKLRGKVYTEKDLEKAYLEIIPKLIRFANSHLVITENAVDIANSVFEKAVANIRKNPKHTINPYLLYREVLRGCRRSNRQVSVELTGKFDERSMDKEILDKYWER